MSKRMCACCGKYELEMPDYDVCEICGWEDDPLQNMKPDYRGGANKMSLNQARENWEKIYTRIY